MKFFLAFLLFSSSSFAAVQTITLSRGTDAVLQDFSELILRNAYKKIGIQLEVIHVPIARSLVLANTGIVDGDVSRISGIEDQFKNLVIVPIAINAIDIRIFAYNEAFVTNNKALKGSTRAGCVRGIILVEKIIKERGITCQMANSYEQAISLLNKKKVDFLILPLTIGVYFQGIDSTFAASHYGESLGNEPLFHYLHIKHKHLANELTQVLEDMLTSSNADTKTYTHIKF